jgi:hypothetical protein
MDTVAYSELLVRFGKNLMRIAEGAEAAADRDIDGADRVAAIEAARKKLAEYDGIIQALSSDSKVLEAQFAKKFSSSIDLIRESLDQIEADPAA